MLKDEIVNQIEKEIELVETIVPNTCGHFMDGVQCAYY